MEHSCAWKIAIENVLATHHVPFVRQNPLARHPEWLQVFRGKADEEGSVAHQFDERFYAESLTEYVHHQVFPNLILGGRVCRIVMDSNDHDCGGAFCLMALASKKMPMGTSNPASIDKSAVKMWLMVRIVVL